MIFVGEGGEPVVREASEAVWDRRGVAAQERSAPVCEVAEGGPNSEEEKDPQPALEGPTTSQSIYQDT